MGIGMQPREISVGGIWISTRSQEEFLADVAQWAHSGESRYVCFVTAHMIAFAQDDIKVRMALSGAAIRTADGTPVAWCAGITKRMKVPVLDGPSLLPLLLARAEQEHLTVGFIGGAPATLVRIVNRVKEDNPNLRIGCVISPPFRELQPEEDEEIVKAVAETGAQMLFVGLGSVKQEKWMAKHQGRVRAVMFGVGAAFNFYAGEKRMPPKWFQHLGLTWLYRLALEPRRLWHRNYRYGTRFLVVAARQLLMRDGLD
jgi:N-acetylglucosaminyldiphosphoundecaprenol N-acetyl-beta-D-mannosaminyltransferase